MYCKTWRIALENRNHALFKTEVTCFAVFNEEIGSLKYWKNIKPKLIITIFIFIIIFELNIVRVTLPTRHVEQHPKHVTGVMIGHIFRLFHSHKVISFFLFTFYLILIIFSLSLSTMEIFDINVSVISKVIIAPEGVWNWLHIIKVCSTFVQTWQYKVTRSAVYSTPPPSTSTSLSLSCSDNTV